MSPVLGRFFRRLESFLADDARYICGACDDRFGCRVDAIAHVVHCHPEFAGVVAPVAVRIDDDLRGWEPPAAGRPFWSAPLWN